MSSQAGDRRELRSVCVVMPVRNEERAVAAAVRSVLSQDFDGPLRLIVVDGGSSDATREFVSDFSRSDRRRTKTTSSRSRRVDGSISSRRSMTR